MQTPQEIIPQDRYSLDHFAPKRPLATATGTHQRLPNRPWTVSIRQSGVHRSCCTVAGVDEHTGPSDVFQEVETNKQKEGLLVDRQKRSD